MSGIIELKCKNCGSDLYADLGERTNGDTITEFIIPVCSCAKRSDNSDYAATSPKLPSSDCCKNTISMCRDMKWDWKYCPKCGNELGNFA